MRADRAVEERIPGEMVALYSGLSWALARLPNQDHPGVQLKRRVVEERLAHWRERVSDGDAGG